MARILKQAYTFDDVLLVPNKSEILPNQEIGRASCRERV